MRAFIATSVLGAIGLAQANAIEYAHSIFEKTEGIPRGWTVNREANHDEPIVLHVSLPYQNVDAFEQRVMDISTPGHALYGQHLEGHEVQDFLRPAAEAKDAIANWLKDHNITEIVSKEDWVTFRTSVRTASELLKTRFSWFNHPEQDKHELRTLEYSVPNHLSEYIDFVHPTIKFPSTRQLGSAIHMLGKPKKGADKAIAAWEAWKDSEKKLGSDISKITPPPLVCGKLITPQCLLTLYNVHYGADAKNGNVMSFASFLNQSARYTDLASFEMDVAMYAEGQNITVTPFAPATNDQTSSDDATEANLDAEYSVAVSYPLPVTEFITAGCGPIVPDPNEAAGSCDNEPYMAFLQGMAALPNSALPQTLSISYGDDEQSWPISMAKKVCTGFAQLGARGVSVMFASGDNGPGNICENNAGTENKFIPTFPAGCPFVTSVGATQNQGPEEAASFSSGGFSNYFKRPSYQKKAIPPFLKQLGSEFSQYYNRNGRGIPDVSAQGVDFLIYSGGMPTAVDGTSCASPTFSSIISLLNSARISSGKAPLGFLNPFLYSTGMAGLTDITTGSSTGCSNGTMTISGAGWTAVKGWDPVTGLGTPNFGNLLKIVAPGVKNKGGPVGGGTGL